jgi:hypothetical protein
MIKDQINLSPDFQRRDIWSIEKRSRFIESIIMNVPIPPVFLGEDQYGKYVVLDGRQRLTAIYEFLRNAYALKGLKVWEELNGSNLNDLEKRKVDKTLTRRFVPAIVIFKESSPQVKYDVFDRLNQGGVIAEPMEIRNAIYSGDFNRLLHSLSSETEFRKLWNIPLDDGKRASVWLYQRMGDLELVLRFFALQNYQAMDMNFKDFLSDFMDRRNKEYKAHSDLIAQDTAIFKRAIANCLAVFGGDAFRRPMENGGRRPTQSAPLADAVMAALSAFDPSALADGAVKARIITAIDKLSSEDSEFDRAISYGTNGKGAIATRIERAKAAVAAVIVSNQD